MSYIERIKEARLSAHLTQSQLAQMVGVGKTTITGYEKGNREMSAAMVAKIAEATNSSIPFIFQDEIREQEQNREQSYKEQNLLMIFRELNEEGQEKMLDYADDLAQSGKYKNHDTVFMGAQAVSA